MKLSPLSGVRPVLICGDGVAAYCCAHLLSQAGIPFLLDRPSRPRLPAIMVSEGAIKLIAEIFGREDLFRELPRVQTRVVLWGSAGQAHTLPHSAVVVSEETLLDSIRPQSAENDSVLDPQWTIFASRPLSVGCTEQRFGSRVARAFSVTLNSDALGCWVESTPDGWLFLVGSGSGEGWLLAVGDADAARSRLIGKQIRDIAQSRGKFPAFPRIVDPLAGMNAAGDGWLACGTAALAFDPICGDGTAHAVREGILAAAVIRAIHDGADADKVLTHYESRLIVGFQRHLTNCVAFYLTGGNGAWWHTELNSIERGISWCKEKMSTFPEFRYRLNGQVLEPA